MSKKKSSVRRNPNQKQSFSRTLPETSNPLEYSLYWDNIPVPFGMRGEQQEIDTWKALITNPDFRKDIRRTQKMLDTAYWQGLAPSWPQDIRELNTEFTIWVTPKLRSFELKHPTLPVSIRPPLVKLRHEVEIERLMKKWALDDLKDGDWWLQNVLRTWDVNGNMSPPLEAPIRAVPLDLPSGSAYVHHRIPLFKTVLVSVERFAPHLAQLGQATPRRVTITLRPGVTIRQARQAAEAAVKSLDSKPRSYRPGLTDYDRSLLWTLFSRDEHLLKSKQSRSQIIEKVWQTMNDWQRPLSRPTIGNALRQWLRERNYPVRRYTTTQRDRRT